MKLQPFLFITIFTMFVLSSCGVVSTIFKAGMWWAFFLVALVIGVILWVVSRAKK